MGIKAIPNQPIELNPDSYETCLDNSCEQCTFIGQNDGYAYTQFQLTPCTSDVPSTGISSSGDWNITGQSACASSPLNAPDYISYNYTFNTYGNYFKYSFKITNLTTGQLNVSFAMVGSNTITANGVYSFFASPAVYNGIMFYADSDFDGCISDVQVDAYYLPSDILEWITLTDIDGNTIPNYEDYLQLIVDGNFITIKADAYLLEKGTFKLKVCDPCVSVTNAPEIEYYFDSIDWTETDNCAYPQCLYPATTSYTGELTITTSGNIGNVIELSFESLPFTLANNSCCHIVKIYLGSVQTFDCNIIAGKGDCLTTFNNVDVTSGNVLTYTCCDVIDSIYFNVLIGETLATPQTITIQKVEIYETANCSTTGTCYESNCFTILPSTELQGTKLIEGEGKNDSYSLGFYFSNNFKLQQRLTCTKFAPDYPIDSKDYIFSDGSRKLTSAQRSKMYDVVFGGLGMQQHDSLSTQILCKKFSIDNVEYFVEPNDYKPEWDRTNAYALSSVRLKAMKQNTIIFRDNQN